MIVARTAAPRISATAVVNWLWSAAVLAVAARNRCTVPLRVVNPSSACARPIVAIAASSTAAAVTTAGRRGDAVPVIPAGGYGPGPKLPYGPGPAGPTGGRGPAPDAGAEPGYDTGDPSGLWLVGNLPGGIAQRYGQRRPAATGRVSQVPAGLRRVDRHLRNTH
ncbi:hypothetical protein [Plantactinospora sp. KBS50]|uniref:hypothetical protein n=1 Tax=Plantactinospora sp. KBS50 TaxID=2024580 RepID=UPI000BAAB5D3|nr:hypothetical protein [Plantactinospora sp. KBS50]ASW53032.1 hypothetical protein CIK06_00760 [Plantactinospora sp. KBS50]